MILCIEALTWLALQKSSNTWKSVFCIAITFHFMKKKHLSLLELFTLKIAFSTFLSLRKNLFSMRGLGILFICLVALNTACVLALTALVFLALKKSSKHENLSSALQITFHFIKRNIFHVLERYLKLHLATFSHWERTFSASVALHSLHLLSCTKHSISVLSSNSISVLEALNQWFCALKL